MTCPKVNTSTDPLKAGKAWQAESKMYSLLLPRHAMLCFIPFQPATNRICVAPQHKPCSPLPAHGLCVHVLSTQGAVPVCK